MASRTISLELSAYERLKAAKRPGESFSDVIHRLLGARPASILGVQSLLDARAGEELATVVARLKRVDLEHQRRRRAPRA